MLLGRHGCAVEGIAIANSRDARPTAGLSLPPPAKQMAGYTVPH